MQNIRELLKAGRVNAAANVLYDSLYYLLNTVPGIQLSREEYAELIPLLVQKIEGEEEEEAPKTPKFSEAPGDDVDVKPSKGVVRITFDVPAGVPVPNRIVGAYAVGQEYKYVMPTIPGYTPDFKVIKGQMGSKDINVVVEYKKDPVLPVEPMYGFVTPKKDNADKNEGYTEGKNEPVVHAYVGGSYDWNVYDAENTEYEDHVKELKAWWPGVVVHSPDGMSEDDFKLAPAKMLNNGTGEWIDFTMGDCAKADDSYKEGSEQVAYVWLPIFPDYLEYPNGDNDAYHYVFQVDWNRDGIYEQTFDAAVVSDNTYLYEREYYRKKGISIYPEMDK